jgi:quercetin dioxygenase-like cupin family protein
MPKPKSSRKRIVTKAAPRKKSNASKTPSAKPARPKPLAGKVPLQHIPWHTIPLEELNPLMQRQFVVGEEIMLARILLKKSCIVPEHSHHNEQLSYVMDGALKFWIDGQEIVVHAGEILCIPGNMAHKVEALEDSVSLDIFSPPRADWINRTDQYLRKTSTREEQ